MVRKSQIPFNAHFFCRQLPGYSIPLLCHNNPHCFCVCVLLEPGKFTELKNLISDVGMGKMQVCF